MKEVGLEEIKRIQLEILDSVHDFCIKNNLKYSLCGGTLLGAVKHKGYVPYDDDIDIMMPRMDYEQFIATYSDEKNFVMNLRDSDSCRELHSKVCRKNTKLVDPILGRSEFSIFIDVCPVDGGPAEIELYYKKIQFYIELIPKVCAFYKVVPQKKSMWKIKYLLKRGFSGTLKNAVTLKREFTSMLAANDLESSPYACEFVVCYHARLILESAVFSNFSEYEFEGRKYMGIRDYDIYLSAKYAYLGDYMDLPPLKKPLHEYTAFLIE